MGQVVSYNIPVPYKLDILFSWAVSLLHAFVRRQDKPRKIINHRSNILIIHLQYNALQRPRTFYNLVFGYPTSLILKSIHYLL